MLPIQLPMLATSGEPFDSPDYRFEIKWDGIRALAAVDTNGWRLWGRDAADYTLRYPELAVLRHLPAGTLVDGELVVRGPTRPTLAVLLRRHHLADAWQIRLAARWCPVRLILFDLLYHRGRSLLAESFRSRRERLSQLFATLNVPELALAEGVVDSGRAFFAAAVAAGHEGIVAKRLDSRYRPGHRSSAWQKIKPRQPNRRRRPAF
jgi:bifunctional non-homologous end joining protein LigD